MAVKDPPRAQRVPEARFAAAGEDEFARHRLADLRSRLTAAGVPLIERADGRPGVTDRDILSDLAFETEQYLRGLSVPQLLCLAYGHKWPELIPGIRLPKGFRSVPAPQRDGIYLITESCIRETRDGICGTRRSSRTLPGTVRGLYDRKHGRSYDYDDDEWEVRPEGSRLTRVDFLNEIWRRMGPQLFPEIIAAAEAQG
jgi:hypothetical protein